MKGVLGSALNEESATLDQIGRFRHYERGSIYWHPTIDAAHAVIGAIRSKWHQLHWELGFLGYPTNSTSLTPTAQPTMGADAI